MILKGTVRRVISHEAGQSLLLAIIIMASLTITTAGVVTFMTSNETSAGRDRDVVRALGGAEAGLSNGISTIMQSDSTNTITAPATLNGNATVDGANVSYTLDKSRTTDNSTTPPTNTDFWTIKSTGTFRGVSRQVQQQVKFIEGVHQDVSVDYQYGLFIGAPPAGQNPACLITLSGDVTATTNVYIGGNLCTNGNVHLTPPATGQLAVYVKGYWDGSGNGSIGTNSLKFAIARIKGGCLDNHGNSILCSSGTNVFALDTNTTPFADLQKPTVHPDTIYNAAPSWISKCTGGFVLDNTAGIGHSVGSQELFPGTSYTCTVAKTDGTTATMSWNSSTNVFNIVGTMFIDGDVTMSTNADWTGNGSIYVNGVAHKGSNKDICGPPKAGSSATGFGCSKTWDTTSITRPGVTTSGSTTVSGLATTSDLAVGMFVSGAGIPTGTKIVSKAANSIVLSAAATASGTPSLTFVVGNFGLVILNPLNAANGYDASGNGELDLDMYIVNGFANNGGTVVTGSVMADGGTVGGGAGFLNPKAPPPDFPITYDTPDSGWTAAPSTWKELK